jgi:hypothetical protein
LIEMSDTETWQKFNDAARMGSVGVPCDDGRRSAEGARSAFRVGGRATMDSYRKNLAEGRAYREKPREKSKVELFYQVGPEFVRLTVSRNARFIDGGAEKKRVPEGMVFEDDLAQFRPGGYQAADFGLLLVTPSRIEMTGMMELFAGKETVGMAREEVIASCASHNFRKV